MRELKMKVDGGHKLDWVADMSLFKGLYSEDWVYVIYHPMIWKWWVWGNRN